MPTWTPEQLKDYEDRSRRKIPHAFLKCDQAPALVRPSPGEEKGVGGVRVCFRGYRVRPLDPDNFAGSVKDCLDYLRHAGLIEGDEWWRITLETTQEKVDHFQDERTVIEIYDPA